MLKTTYQPTLEVYVPSAELVKQIEMEIGEARSEIRLLEAAQAVLAGRANGAGPETQPAGPRKPGRPRKTTRHPATTRATAKTTNGRRKAAASTRRRKTAVAAN